MTQLFRSIFFSHNYPVTSEQEALVRSVERWVTAQGMLCNTVIGLTSSNFPAIDLIRRQIEQSDAVIAFALPRFFSTPQPLGVDSPVGLSTTPWVHMEAAMAIQSGKPLALIKDFHLPREGIFDFNATHLPVLELESDVTAEDMPKLLTTLVFSKTDRLSVGPASSTSAF